MKKLGVIVYFIMILVACTDATTSKESFGTSNEEKSCNFFLIKEVNSEVVIEKVKLTDGELRVFKADNLLSYIMVFPAGSKSGEIIQTSQRISGIIARFANNKIKVSILQKDGAQKEMPDIDLEEAHKIDVRLNVTGANGYEKAFIVERYETVKIDDGPVLDIFSGQIPLNQGDYSFFVECMEAKGGNAIEGVVPYKIHRGWITVDCKFHNGVTGRFVADLGASNTCIPKSMLPEGNKISKLQMVAHSSEGVKVSKAVSEGASGKVENIGGVSVLNDFHIGNITLNDLKVTVLEDFPQPFIDAGIDGVLGRDVLMKADYFEIKNLKGNSTEKTLVFTKEENDYKDYNYKIPFNIAGGGNIYYDGKIKDSPVHFFFDSGAGNSILNKEFLDSNKIPYISSGEDKTTSYGIDGKGTDFDEVKVKDIQIGAIKINKMSFKMSDVNVLQRFGMKENTCLLGMDFLSNYSKVVFDFRTNTMMLWE